MPVIFLTARDDPADLREGFTGGGDDYLTKPFSLEELVLRVEAMLRRGRAQTNARTRVAVGDIVLDDDAHRVWRADREIELSPTEYRLLRYLMHNAGRVLSRPQIIEHVWDYATLSNPPVWRPTSATCGASWTTATRGSSAPCVAWGTPCASQSLVRWVNGGESQHPHCARRGDGPDVDPDWAWRGDDARDERHPDRGDRRPSRHLGGAG